LSQAARGFIDGVKIAGAGAMRERP